MKAKHTYREVKEADYIMKMMEDVFGHRVTSWSPADTRRLHKKLSQPVTDKEREEFTSIVEPRMMRKSYISPDKDRYLDAFLDLDTRVSQKDFEPTEDPDAEKLDKLLGIDLS